MTSLQKKVTSAIAAGALLLQVALPVLAQSTTLVITGNGAESDSDINVAQTTTTTVVQNNTANISNDVDADADTGNNDANYNTGGAVSISTGDAATGVAISNTANSNVAEVNGCCDADVEVEISENGYKSDNEANLKLNTATNVFQNNSANIKNDVDADSDTGDNDANYNTGGPVSIETGDADTTVLIANQANSNWAKVGDGSGGASVKLKIVGNLAESDNDINLLFDRSLTLTQDNYANIKNDVDADSDTGKNDANYNGGAVSIDTGDATVGVGIDNMANFNFADLDCGCILDVLAKVAGNGYKSDNEINAALLDSKLAFQSNEYLCGKYGYPYPGLFGLELDGYGGYHKKACNDVDADADTGNNDAEKNTSWSGDPSIETGDAATLVDIENTANSNVLVEGGGPGFPELPDFDFDFDLGFNWLLWWGLLSGNSS